MKFAGSFRKARRGLSFLVLILLLFSISGCHLAKPRPLTIEEQDYYMAKQQCAQEASWMYPEWPCSGNPDWDSYFVMCMNNLGVPDAVIYRMWY